VTTLRQIEAFRAVMITGTVTQAAESLSISQPAISRMIADLEAAVDFKLFIRANRQLIPTAEGQAFYDEVERAFVGLGEINRAAADIREYRRGLFRIITIPSLVSTVMADLMVAFCARHPSIAVSVDVQPSQRVFEWIISQQCDMGLTTLPMVSPNIEARPLARAAAVCALPAGHRLAAYSVVRPEDLAGESFISFKAESTFRLLVDDVFRQAGVRREMRIEARTTEAVCSMVAAGLGVSIIGPTFRARTLPNNMIERPFEPALMTEFALIYPSNRPLSRIAQQFTTIAEAYMAEQLVPAA